MKTPNVLRGRRKEVAAFGWVVGKAMVRGDGALRRGVQVESSLSFLPSFLRELITPPYLLTIVSPYVLLSSMGH